MDSDTERLIREIFGGSDEEEEEVLQAIDSDEEEEVENMLHQQPEDIEYESRKSDQKCSTRFLCLALPVWYTNLVVIFLPRIEFGVWLT